MPKDKKDKASPAVTRKRQKLKDATGSAAASAASASAASAAPAKRKKADLLGDGPAETKLKPSKKAKAAPAAPAPAAAKAAPSTSKPEASAPAAAAGASRLDEKQVLLAVKALCSHLEREAAGGKKDLSYDQAPINLCIATKDMPKAAGKAKVCKPVPMALPHPYVQLDTLELCLITKDPQREYKDKLADAGVSAKVIGVTKLKKKYHEHEAKRELCARCGGGHWCGAWRRTAQGPRRALPPLAGTRPSSPTRACCPSCRRCSARPSSRSGRCPRRSTSRRPTSRRSSLAPRAARRTATPRAPPTRFRLARRRRRPRTS